jgi:hypothetical protein
MIAPTFWILFSPCVLLSVLGVVQFSLVSSIVSYIHLQGSRVYEVSSPQYSFPLDAIPAHLHLETGHVSNAAAFFGFFIGIFGMWIALHERLYVNAQVRIHTCISYLGWLLTSPAISQTRLLYPLCHFYDFHLLRRFRVFPRYDCFGLHLCLYLPNVRLQDLSSPRQPGNWSPLHRESLGTRDLVYCRVGTTARVRAHQGRYSESHTDNEDITVDVDPDGRCNIYGRGGGYIGAGAESENAKPRKSLRVYISRTWGAGGEWAVRIASNI